MPLGKDNVMITNMTPVPNILRDPGNIGNSMFDMFCNPGNIGYLKSQQFSVVLEMRAVGGRLPLRWSAALVFLETPFLECCDISNVRK